MRKLIKYQAILFLLLVFITGCSSRITSYPLIDTKLKLHKYGTDSFKETFFLKDSKSISLYCIKHSEWEDIKGINSINAGDNSHRTLYKVTKNEEKDGN
jgi:hypothetical protein